MKHVNAIKNLVEQGQFDHAEDAIENLLTIGPNNIEALKLLAKMYAHKGNFEEEEKTWQRIWQIDAEDEEVIEYFHKAQMEDREHYYFTDILPGGGRRFLTYPRLLINMTALGLLGCVAFIALTQTNADGSFIQKESLVLGLFLVCVILPWFGIGFAWIRALKSIEVNAAAINLDTRLRSHKLAWDDIQSIYLAHSLSGELPKLQLVIVTRPNLRSAFFIDLTEGSSSIRARRFLLGEIKEHYHPITPIAKDSLTLNERKMFFF